MPNVDGAAPSSSPVPWHREPWVWLLVAIPGSAVLMGAVLLTLSITSYDGLVADDYYKRGLEINRSLRRDRYAYDAALRAQVEFRVRTGGVHRSRVVLEVGPGVAYPPQLRLTFQHSTRGGLDETVELHREAGLGYLGPPVQLPPGRWQVQLETPDWRLVGRLVTPSERSITLDGSPPK